MSKYRRYNPSPIKSFIAGLLQLALILIVLNVVYLWAKTKNETGKEINIPQALAEETRGLWEDLKVGWNGTTDTTSTRSVTTTESKPDTAGQSAVYSYDYSLRKDTIK